MSRPLYWVSFSLEGKFNGACILEASDERAAVERAKTLGIHPGGDEAALRIVPERSRPEVLTKIRKNRHKLLTEAECEAIFGPLHRTLEERDGLLYGSWGPS